MANIAVLRCMQIVDNLHGASLQCCKRRKGTTVGVTFKEYFVGMTSSGSSYADLPCTPLPYGFRRGLAGRAPAVTCLVGAEETA